MGRGGLKLVNRRLHAREARGLVDDAREEARTRVEELEQEVLRGEVCETRGEFGERFIEVAALMEKPKGLIDIEVDGEKIVDKIRRLDEWRRSKNCFPHAEAYLQVERLIPALSQRPTLDQVAEKLPKEVMYSGAAFEERMARRGEIERIICTAADPSAKITSPVHPSSPEDVYREHQLEVVREQCEAEGRIFPRVPAFVSNRAGFSYDTALSGPRIFGGKDLKLFGLTDEDLSVENALAYQLYAIEATRRAFRDQSSGRLPYAMAQGSILISDLCNEKLKAGRKKGIKGPLPNGKSMLAPATAVFRGKSKESVRSYINAMMSLLIPDKEQAMISDSYKPMGFIQDDYITVNCMVLAQEHGIFSEYKQLFEDLLYCEQVQNRSNLASVLLETRGQIAADKAANSDGAEVELSLSSFGCGKSPILETYFARMGYFQRVKGVDINRGVTERRKEGNSEFVTVDVAGEEDGGIEKSLAELPKADMVIALDALHETKHPARVFQGLLKKVKAKGGLVLLDPTYVGSNDALTPVTVFNFDNTQYPESMKSWADFNEMVAYATLKGFKVHMEKILTGTHYGYGDPFFRILVVLTETDRPLRYSTPTDILENKKTVENPEDIFEVWPFNKIKLDDRDKLLDAVGEDIVGKQCCNLWVEVIKSLDLDGGLGALLLDEGQSVVQNLERAGLNTQDILTLFQSTSEKSLMLKLEREVKDNLPYPYVDELLKRLDIEDDELKDLNVCGSLVKLLKKYLKEIDIELDLSTERGWER